MVFLCGYGKATSSLDALPSTLCDWLFKQLVLQLDGEVWESSSNELDCHINERVPSPEM